MALTQSYALCALCLRRQGHTSELALANNDDECFICRGLMNALTSRGREAAKKAKRYEFRTFSVGVSIPEGPQEREDELRSVLRLKGSETIKAQAARIIGEVIAAKGKLPDRLRPDLTLLVHLDHSDPQASSRSLFYYARYSKGPGLSQRRERCPRCSGAGCENCGKRGFLKTPSVEGYVRTKVGSLTGSGRMTFTWLGTEDRDSRVSPPGRPFILEVKDPKKRRMPRRFAIRTRWGPVTVSSGRMLASRPTELPRFRFRTRITAEASSKVGREALAKLPPSFRKAEVVFRRPHDRPALKTVYRASATARGKKLVIDAELDGGLPVKRLVSGELVSPSFSEVLGTSVKCLRFDILRVTQIRSSSTG